MHEGNEMHRWAERRAGAFAGGVVRVEDEHDVYRRKGKPCRVWGMTVMKREGFAGGVCAGVRRARRSGSTRCVERKA